MIETGDASDRLDWAFVLGLVGGVIILVGSLVMWPMMWMMGRGGGWGMMHGFGGWAPDWWWGWTLLMGAWGILLGAIVLVAAVRIRARPESAESWGITMIVAGALSLIGMGGYLVGAVAAIAGGAFAILGAPGRAVQRPRHPGG